MKNGSAPQTVNLQRWLAWIGPLVAVAAGVSISGSGFSREIAWTGGVTLLCAVWWIFEVVPIPVTSLLPLAVFPLVGVLTPEQVAESYGSHLVLLMLGGFILSSAMERSGAHRRIALNMVSLFGGAGGRRLVFGFMTASAVLSMWISNAATTLMLLPIAMAIVSKLDDERLATSLLLGMAYAASVGGIGTPIGTPPNLVFREIYLQSTGIDITFSQWMSWTLPIVVIMIPIVGLWLTRGLKHQEAVQLPEVGAWRAEETRMLMVFAATAILWITRTEPFGGWSDNRYVAWLDFPQANDASVALLAVIVMFLIPNGRGERLLDWPTARNIQWGILILYGGGIAIAKAFISSGLDHVVGDALSGIGELPVLMMLLLICLVVTFLTEITSNTATANLILPVLVATAVSAKLKPELIMVPATISASFAFMLPVATPPNAIVFGSGQMTIGKMAREGLMLNVLGALVISLVCAVIFR